ncbi:MAG TPA: hypothetical protein VGB42_02530, partial [Candidatus Thermoplasmatota archaeon]
TFYAAVVRTLGTADVYESSSGRLIREDVPLPVVTVVAQRMLTLVEFRDLNGRNTSGDGIFNYRPNLSTPEILDFNASEPLVKALQLNGNWSLSGFELAAAGDDAASLDYTLTLAGVPYTRAGNAEWAGDGQVEAVSFHVHLEISRRTETLEFPHYNASVVRTRDGRELASITPAGTTNGTATITKARLKVDHEVVGWDPAPTWHDGHSRLLLIAAMPVLNGVHDAMAPWVNERALTGDRAGTARAELPEGESVVISEEESQRTETFARALSLELRDNWRRVAHLEFEPTVQVWPRAESEAPETGAAFLQVLGGAPVAERMGDTAFRGFLLLTGFSYPAGYRVYHDPEVVAEGIVLDGDSILPAVLPALVMAAQFAVTALAVGGAVALALYTASTRARARATRDRQRLAALKERYRLPPGGDGG